MWFAFSVCHGSVEGGARTSAFAKPVLSPSSEAEAGAPWPCPSQRRLGRAVLVELATGAAQVEILTPDPGSRGVAYRPPPVFPEA